MYIDFSLLPDTSRVWVYQADRSFTNDERQEIERQLIPFVQNWKRHGEDLKASFQIKYNQFIILAVDESFTNVSGCSIDASVHIIKEIQKKFGIDLLNKMNVTFKDGNNVNIVSLSAFKEFAKLDKVTSNTLVFNNMITSKADLDASWEVKASDSWHAKFLKQ